MGEPAKIVEKSPSGVSQHLARLRMARMVTTRQDGTKVLYTLIARHPRWSSARPSGNQIPGLTLPKPDPEFCSGGSGAGPAMWLRPRLRCVVF
ncbi:hypothetical protein [Paeniglutamicibacter sp. ZC-3]|uniref:hypothetical protein n=1 Tax=Paeniglutamicibacter sp. ZC-3 TaxID=2986919 RepID=UPI003557A02B